MAVRFIKNRGVAAERVDIRPTSPWWGEHRSRYHFAARHVRGKTVLDIACGSGFGSKILRDAGAGFVVGADLAWDAVRETSDIDEVSVCVTDGTKLALRSASVDVVASFETLEHVQDDVSFVSELRRVLASDGVLVLSTPNAYISRPVDGKPQNPFHIREYEPAQLGDLLESAFSDVTLVGQRARPAYRINPFWQPRHTLPTDLRSRVAVASWRAQHRLPFAVKDRVSRLVHNRGFYPGEYDWIFTPEGIEAAHVIVAVCRP